MVDRKLDGERRRDGSQDGRVRDDLAQAERAEHDEPHHHHGSEYSGDAGGTPALHREQADQDRDGDREDPILERG